MKTTLIPTLTIALVLLAPTFTQAASEANTQPPSTAASQQSTQKQNHESNVLTINKLKHDLEKAGFSDVKILQELIRGPG